MVILSYFVLKDTIFCGSMKVDTWAQLFEAHYGLNPGFSFLCSKAFSRIISSVIFRAFNHKLEDKRIKTERLFKLWNLNSNLTLTLDYLNPALNNSALVLTGRKALRRKVNLKKMRFSPENQNCFCRLFFDLWIELSFFFAGRQEMITFSTHGSETASDKYVFNLYKVLLILNTELSISLHCRFLWLQ